MENIIGTMEAAKIIGCHQDHIKRLARQGVIKAVKVGKSWLFNKSDIIAFKPANQGRPRKKSH